MAQRLIIHELSVQYSASELNALSALTMNVAAGSCCAILGPTGAGKSTLLHCLAGTLRRHHPECVSTGSIQVGDTAFEGLPVQIQFPTTGLVLQDPYVQISGVRDTVYDEILFTLENLDIMPENPRTAVEAILQALGIDHLSHRKPTSLSGGETQRVALAAIMVAQPEVLLLDEPATALDSNAQDKLRHILRSLHGNTTILLTEAQIDFAIAVADQVIVLDRGTVVFQGDSQMLMSGLHTLSNTLPVDDWLRGLNFLTSQGNHPLHKELVKRTLGLK